MPSTIREQLLALTPLESTFAASLVALDEDRVPRWWSVRELIAAFLHLRDSVVLRRSEYRLEKVTARRHLVAGLMTIHLDIDAAVAVIRGSDTVDEARQGLQERFANRRRTSRLRSGAAAAAADQARRHRAAGRSGEAGRRVPRADRIGVESRCASGGDRQRARRDRKTVQRPRIRPSHRAGLRGHTRPRRVPTRMAPASVSPTPRGDLMTAACSPTATAICSPRVWAGRCGPTGESSSPPATVCRTRSATSRWRRTSPGCCGLGCSHPDRIWHW